MPKVTYPHRCHCLHCTLTFSCRKHLRRHVQRQHSDNPPRFFCHNCGKGFTCKQNRNLHLTTVCAEEKPCYCCLFCNATFTRPGNLQKHQRLFHACICQDQDMNLLLHLQRLSEEPECTNEWLFVESRPIEGGKPRICPCGQTNIKEYYFLENKINGNRTYVGSTCIEHIDPRVGKVVGYFQHLLCKPIQGTYVGDLNGQQTFTVASNTKLVEGADTIVHHLHPQVFKTLDEQWRVLVKYPHRETLIPGQAYELCLKAKYVQGQLTFTAV